MGLNWIMWSMVVLLSILSAVLLSGHGSSMIAGYNTASQKEKAAYDEKKLCRVTGIGMAAITVLLVLLALFPGNSLVVGLFSLGTIIVCVGCIISSNTICKIKNASEIYVTDKEKKRTKKHTVIVLVLSALTLIVVSITLFTGDVTVSLSETAVAIKVSYWSDRKIPYGDIRSVTYAEGILVGSRTNGLGTPKLRAGNFKNDAFGEYQLYSYTECNHYIILDVKTGTVAINGKDVASTKQLYEDLKKKMEEL